MFTGIVKGLFKVQSIDRAPGLLRLGIEMTPEFTKGLEIGASVSINGVCLTVVRQDNSLVHFDLIQETLDRTNLTHLSIGDLVNTERSARFGDEIGGHLLSGHIFGQAVIQQIDTPANNHIITLQAPQDSIKYFFSKGYIALDGVSLTLVEVSKQENTFSVHLIPETLRQTTFGFKQTGSKVNVEIDTQTQILVDSLTT